ncbi:mechanosensitive ion channel protein MscS [Enterobacteriaceae bacterium 89]|nr:mechanosensitive ion channel protein MscS [Enterobacteriaceae bacterium 89]
MQSDSLHTLDSVTHWFDANKALMTAGAVNLLMALVLFVVGLCLARMAGEGVQKVLAKRGVDHTVTQFFSVLLRYALIVFFIVAALERIGVETSSLIAVIGAAGLAVGLALQGSLANFAAGVMLVTFRPVRVGEYATVGAVAGTIQEINIFSTTLTTPDNKTVVVPNGKIISGEITNFTRQKTRRVDLAIGVANTASVAQVKDVITTVIQLDSRVLHDNGVTVRLMELTPTAMNFVVRAWAPNKQYWDVYFDLLEQIKTALDDNQIPMPYPHMHLHLAQNAAREEQALTHLS